MSCCPENNITPIPCVEDAAQLLLDKLDLQKVITETEKNIATLPPEYKANAQKGLDSTKAMQNLLLAVAECNFCCIGTGGSSGSGSDGILDGGFRLTGIGLLDGGFRV
jgi:hypothetical protein